MSGFKEDVLAILRDNVMLHNEALGWVFSYRKEDDDGTELYNQLMEMKFPVTNKLVIKPVVLFDYIIIPKASLCVPILLEAFSLLSILGIIIVDVSEWDNLVVKDYKSVFGNFTATALNYGDRKYLVIHAGVDYGN
jgi:hypothetical protein